MTKIYLSIGSNISPRRKYIRQALEGLKSLGCTVIRLSPLYETAGIFKSKVPYEWQKDYINLVAECKYDVSPYELLEITKEIEKKLYRKEKNNEAPRTIDIDIILFGDKRINTKELTIPHPYFLKRSFVLNPLKDLIADKNIHSENKTILELSRQLPIHQSLLMGILNITPDSFSDGGCFLQVDQAIKQAKSMFSHGAHIIDIGAQSTRPNAHLLDATQEWERLKPVLDEIIQFKKDCYFKPIISVDSFYPEIAEKSLKIGVDMINDVGGLENEKMRKLAKESKSHFTFMHQMGVPVNLKNHLPLSSDPLRTIYDWAVQKLDELDKYNIPLQNLFFDPGIGFGKTQDQSLDIIKSVELFLKLPVKLLIGHSRKSFFNQFTTKNFSERDIETVSVSSFLQDKKIDVLRVHNVEKHTRYFKVKNRLLAA